MQTFSKTRSSRYNRHGQPMYVLTTPEDAQFRVYAVPEPWVTIIANHRPVQYFTRSSEPWAWDLDHFGF